MHSISPGRLSLKAPRWSRDLPRHGQEVDTVQFDSLPPISELEQIAAFIAQNPHVELRAYGGYDGSIRDVDFLSLFPSIRRVSIDALFRLESLDGLRYLPDTLEELTLGRTRRRYSLKPIARFRGLRRLYLEGHTKDIEAIGDLTSVEDLTLRSITLPDLELLRGMTKLRALDIKLGGTRSLSPVAELGEIEYLELWMIRGFDDLAPVAEMRSLRYLFLQALSQVREMPDFGASDRLERVEIETLKNLKSLDGLASAPALRQLAFFDMPQLRWEHLACFERHRSLEEFNPGTRSAKRNRSLAERLGYRELGPTPTDLRYLRNGNF